MSVGDLAIEKGIPYLAKKGFEAGRYYASEAMRNPRLQKKAINYTLNKAQPAFQKVGSELLNQLSTKVRPNKRYKTDRRDLDGAGFDIHKAIGKLPKPKRGWVLPGHHFTGPFNNLQTQLSYDPETAEIWDTNNQQVPPMLSLCNTMLIIQSAVTRKKNTVRTKKSVNTKRTKKMVKALDAVPWKQRQYGHTLARNAINVKQKLGLGLKRQKIIIQIIIKTNFNPQVCLQFRTS